jgi:NOL1/NOP2/fmu family ribosome biogenesis protein
VPEWGQEPENPRLAGCFRLWPHHLHGEGHFVAVLKKAGTLPELEESESPIDSAGNPKAENGRNQKVVAGMQKKRKAATGKNKSAHALDREQQKALEEFLESTLTKETAEWILRGELTLFGDQLFRLPEQAPSLQGLRVLRAGLHIGEFRKNRLEPSHALALALGRDEVRNTWDLKLSDTRVHAFFKGETLQMEEGHKGWTLVCVDGFSAGWGKSAGCQLKNHYPKGLRRDIY